jgi:S-formylglutathione hydrolase FrmB
MRYGLCVTIIFFGLDTLLFGAELKVVSIPSNAMKTRYNASVITPDSYKNSNERYPAAYLLHGYSGDYSTWPDVAPLKQYADTYQMIFICPDGGFNSWYIDSPEKARYTFETYIVFEVTHWIDSVYRTVASYKGRALAGSSMGGHGALTLMMKHPDMFLAASSISGVMDITEFPGNWDLAAVLGDFTDNKKRWFKNSVPGLLESFKRQKRYLILDCGVEDFALNGNRIAHAKMIALGIEHDYYERPGGHTPLYSKKCLEFHLLFFSKVLER